MKARSKFSMLFAFAAVIGLAVGDIDDSFARGGGFSGGGRSFSSGGSRSFSSGGGFKSSPSHAPSVSRHSAPASPTPKSVAPTRSEPAKPGFKTTSPATPAPMAKTFDASGAKANREESSRRNYQAAHPATQTSASRPYEYKRDHHVQSLRSELAGEKWKNRQLRQDQVYGSYYNRPAAPIFAQPSYHDPFGNMFFWMWLMDRPSHDRDKWVYNHQGDMDPARLAELKSKDADLERRLKALEKDGVKRDSSYTPPELKGNKDLMYGDDVVKEAAKAEHSMSGLWLALGGLLALAALVYLFFFKRWNTGVKHAK